ncbi:maltotransferase domain-containing protein [Polymorphospora rubra]|uniref:maltotransferase domain-containing protein n=1 Tax=Polymorphospora rubra TaxID=338584 RepID=UPI0033F203C7
MTARIVIEAVTPVVDGGRHPAKAVVGECLPLRATVWREGHTVLSVATVWRGPGDAAPVRVPMAVLDAGRDTWTATVVPDRVGRAGFHIEAWHDPWLDWCRAVRTKTAAGLPAAELDNDLELGARLLDAVAARAHADRDPVAAGTCAEAAALLRDAGRTPAGRAAAALGAEVSAALDRYPTRELFTTGADHEVYVDRPRAQFSAWYQVFPRSTGGLGPDGEPVHGTLRTAAADLPRIAAMGFDVVYLTPVHPIGTVARKGRNNSPTAGPDEPGCPWAIGSADGGHDSIAPQLGTPADFDAYVAAAGDLGLEVAMDLALHCAPDHPWVTAHPQWFTTRPDGSIACAENPPRRWQDIYPLNFDNDPEGLFAEISRVLRHWIDRGVRIFRVDNPHNKPVDFWARLIWHTKAAYPDVLFLAEAFTRPAVQRGLSRLGFSQTYTYFTWRTGKRELVQFGEELVELDAGLRPNLWPTTHDVLPAHLQQGGPAMFAIRATLAATLSPSWGICTGYELFEDAARRPGSEEHLDSDKFQVRARDFAAARAAGRSLEPWLTTLNRIRRAHPALQQLRTLRFHDVDNEALIAYSKIDPATGDTVICVVTLNPYAVERGVLTLDPRALDPRALDRRTPVPDDRTDYELLDEVDRRRWLWGRTQKIELDPAQRVAYILTLA